MLSVNSTAGVLIVNTYRAELGGYMGSSARNLARKLGSEFTVRTVSATGEIGPVPEQGVILKGSPYSILEPLEWITHYRRFILEMVNQGKVVLGICFGHQGLAESFGGTIEHVGSPQFGIQTIRLTEEGQRHPLFEGLPAEIRLPSSHFDHVAQIARTRQRTLATTDTCPHYAIDIETGNGGTAWGLQFHPEMNGERLAEVIEMKKEHIPDWRRRKREAKKAILDDCGERIIQNYGRAVLKAKRE